MFKVNNMRFVFESELRLMKQSKRFNKEKVIVSNYLNFDSNAGCRFFNYCFGHK